MIEQENLQNLLDEATENSENYDKLMKNMEQEKIEQKQLAHLEALRQQSVQDQNNEPNLNEIPEEEIPKANKNRMPNSSMFLTTLWVTQLHKIYNKFPSWPKIITSTETKKKIH